MASRVAAQQLEKAALDVDLLSQQLGDAKDIKSLQAVLTASCHLPPTKTGAGVFVFFCSPRPKCKSYAP